ncbi:hypothetical protein MPLSOD_220005 [Mesorhizobium sp. SOD10]|nr:hypothetical protein MPLSOD_220005 [Mesorhizobium sp. SOD10]
MKPLLLRQWFNRVIHKLLRV